MRFIVVPIWSGVRLIVSRVPPPASVIVILKPTSEPGQSQVAILTLEHCDTFSVVGSVAVCPAGRVKPLAL
jgi:hypothetical protein